MTGETQLTVVGNLTEDASLRFTASGVAVANWTVASTPRQFDKATNEWKDLPTLFLRCTLWRQPAENVAESLVKGMRVIVQGRLVQRSFETREGEKRTVVELEVDEVGPSLRYATARVNRTTPGGGQRLDQRPQQPVDDPWASTPPVGSSNTGGGSWPQGDEPPFAY